MIKIKSIRKAIVNSLTLKKINFKQLDFKSYYIDFKKKK